MTIATSAALESRVEQAAGINIENILEEGIEGGIVVCHQVKASELDRFDPLMRRAATEIVSEATYPIQEI